MALAGPSGASASAEPLEWHFSQVFGERSPGEEVQEGGWALGMLPPGIAAARRQGAWLRKNDAMYAFYNCSSSTRPSHSQFQLHNP